MSTRLILLAADARPSAQELRLDAAGHVAARRSLPADAAAPSAAAAADAATRPRTIVVVPGQDLRVAWLELADGTPLQVLAAARRVLEEQVAAGAETVHVAVGEGAAGAPRPVAVVDRQRMRAWLDACAALGVVPDALVPDCLMMAEPAEAGIEVFDRDQAWVVRGPQLAFSAEPALAGAVLGTRPFVLLTEAQAASRLATTAARVPLDLLQFEFAPRSPALSRRLRRLAWLAALALCLPLLALAAQSLRHAWGAYAARAQIETLARQHAIAGTDADAVAAHFRQWSAADRFAAQSGALFAALAQQPDARLRSLAFDTHGGMDVQLHQADAQAVELLRTRLAAAGLRVQLLDQSAAKIVETAKKTGAEVSGPIPLPTEKEIITILRAVHKYKHGSAMTCPQITATKYRQAPPLMEKGSAAEQTPS